MNPAHGAIGISFCYRSPSIFQWHSQPHARLLPTLVSVSADFFPVDFIHTGVISNQAPRSSFCWLLLLHSNCSHVDSKQHSEFYSVRCPHLREDALPHIAFIVVVARLLSFCNFLAKGTSSQTPTKLLYPVFSCDIPVVHLELI